MFKSACTFLGSYMISVACFAGPTTLDCQSSSDLDKNLNEISTVVEKAAEECPEPTKEQFDTVCAAIMQKNPPQIAVKGMSYAYQENLWKISCATPGKDNIETAKVKVQAMWAKYRSNFRCYNYTTSTATEKNILKFTVDSGFPDFLYEAIGRYKLDMNFKDPADNKTILDFVKERELAFRNNPPVNTPKADEYKEIYQLLESKGAKQAKDI